MFYRKLKKRLANLQASVDFREKIDFEIGEHLKKSPFIPEYIGFVETVHKTKSSVAARIYSKNGYNIAKSVSTNRNEWSVLDPNGVTNSVLMENMHSAIVVLRACGMHISAFDYHQENKRLMEELQNKIKSDLDEAKKLEED